MAEQGMRAIDLYQDFPAIICLRQAQAACTGNGGEELEANHPPMVIIPITSTEATLYTAGGKGANLARLTRLGFRVPPGFIISTDAYHLFVDANHLAEEIAASLQGLAADNLAQLEDASASIRLAFSAGEVPGATELAIRVAYGEMNGAPVAVRSSATLEDLPDMSFAGQQDTFLNVAGADALLKAVVDCWSSLWTARAIGYRMRNGIHQHEAALAVVVQEMVQSDVSGVLFTANPLTGNLSETVIDATFGLGEALVSGQVEPDHFVVSSLDSKIIEKREGTKQFVTRSKTGGGVETMAELAGRGKRSPMAKSSSLPPSADRSKTKWEHRRTSSGL